MIAWLDADPHSRLAQCRVEGSGLEPDLGLSGGL